MPAFLAGLADRYVTRGGIVAAGGDSAWALTAAILLFLRRRRAVPNCVAWITVWNAFDSAVPVEFHGGSPGGIGLGNPPGRAPADQ